MLGSFSASMHISLRTSSVNTGRFGLFGHPVIFGLVGVFSDITLAHPWVGSCPEGKIETE